MGSVDNAIILLLSLSVLIEFKQVSAQNQLFCPNPASPCYRRVIRCPPQCPLAKPSDPNVKACFLNCNSPKCEALCRVRKPNCDGIGAGCYDPRFIGGDGVVFYFHGRKDEHFALVSDPNNLHINARFIGLRPSGRTRDFTWMQALGLVLRNNSHTFTVEAIRSHKWEEEIDHLRFTYDGRHISLPVGHLSQWKSAGNEVAVERTASKNSVAVNIEGIARISISVVPITEEDDRVHKYGVPENDCFAHLEVQFEFFRMSPEVEGVLGRTYSPDYVSTAKVGVPMPVSGGEDKYKTSSLLSTDCNVCSFSPMLAVE